MAIPKNEPTTVLGEAIRKRIQQLGLSRRELAKRSGISKQTIHELEHSDKGFSGQTLELLDAALKWEPGTSLEFWMGNPNARDGGEAIETRVTEYLTKIIRHLATMGVDELEREVIMLEEETFGRSFPNIEEAIPEYEARLQSLASRLTETWESLNGNAG